MTRPGPAPTPTPQLKLAGSWRAKKRKAEPKPKAGRPRCPTHLSPDARRAWKAIIPQLAAMGVLTKIDGTALVLLVETWAIWREAEGIVRKQGMVYEVLDEYGDLKIMRRRPEVAIMNEASRQLLRLLQEFGLTPSARTRLTVDDAPEREDLLKDYMAG